jgi:hypothetical protein
MTGRPDLDPRRTLAFTRTGYGPCGRQSPSASPGDMVSRVSVISASDQQQSAKSYVQDSVRRRRRLPNDLGFEAGETDRVVGGDGCFPASDLDLARGL